jgi:transposase
MKDPTIKPRISMILALDSNGKTYASLTQANSNQSVMQVFIKGLVDILEKEDRHFRTNTIFFWDGASYHTGKEMVKTLRDLDLPFVFLAPYSYNSAPCELAFGQFKNTHINI